MFNRILTWIKYNPDNWYARSKITHSYDPGTKCKKDSRTEHDKYLDWANRSGLYQKLSDRQKKYLDKIEDILDRNDWNN